MIFQYVPDAVVYVTSAIISGFLSWYVWGRRSKPGGFYFSMQLLASTEWALVIALEMTTIDTSLRYLFHVLLYAGYMATSPLWLMFTLEYSNHPRWLTLRRRLIIWATPAIMMLLVLTNPWHMLVWSKIIQTPGPTGTQLVYGMGIGDWIIMGYSIVITTIGTLILFRKALSSPPSKRRRTITLIIGSLIPWSWAIIYASNASPLHDFDLAPFAFALTGIVFALGIFGQHLFDIAPIARKTLIASMADGVMVLDSGKRILEINPAGYQLAGAKGMVAGQPSETALAVWPVLEQYCRDYSEKSAEIKLGEGREAVWLDTCISPLYDRYGTPSGMLITMRDITERKLGEEELQRAYNDLISSNRALQVEASERRKAEGHMMASLHEKEVLLKEVHHRVKNNLQIISSLLNLQSVNMNRETAAAFNESQNRIKSMALIHEQLYQSTDLSRINFAEYVRSLTAHLSRSYVTGPNVSIVLDIDEVSLDIDTAGPCGLIINELVTNSLKYAFRSGRKGAISIMLKRSGDAVRLIVMDDGEGMPPMINFRETSSLGLQLVNVLVGQIEGIIELDSTAGTKFTITFRERLYGNKDEPRRHGIDGGADKI